MADHHGNNNNHNRLIEVKRLLKTIHEARHALIECIDRKREQRILDRIEHILDEYDPGWRDRKDEG